MADKIMGIDPEELAREYAATNGVLIADCMTAALRAIEAKAAPKPAALEWGDWQIIKTPFKATEPYEMIQLPGGAVAYRVRRAPKMETEVRYVSLGRNHWGTCTHSDCDSTHRMTATRTGNGPWSVTCEAL